jgi:hypothetical protein
MALLVVACFFSALFFFLLLLVVGAKVNKHTILFSNSFHPSDIQVSWANLNRHQVKRLAKGKA